MLGMVLIEYEALEERENKTWKVKWTSGFKVSKWTPEGENMSIVLNFQTDILRTQLWLLIFSEVCRLDYIECRRPNQKKECSLFKYIK